jgi:tetratricopeptide (TPR) repeat protein
MLMKTFSISIVWLLSVSSHQLVAHSAINTSAWMVLPRDQKPQEAEQKEKALSILAQAVQVAETEHHASIKAELLASLAPIYIRLGEQAKGNALIARAQQLIEEEDNPAKDCDDCPVKDFYRIMLAIDLVQSGRPNQALEMLERMVRSSASGPVEIRGQRLAALARVFVGIGSKERAFELLSESLSLAGNVSDPIHKAVLLEDLAKGHAAIGQLERALFVANEMEKGPFKDKALIAIAKKYTELRQFDRALKINDEIDTVNFRPDILTFVAGQYLRNGEKEKGIALLQKALAASAEMDAPNLRQFARTDIALLFAEAGHYQQALKISKATRTPTLKLKLAPILARAGRHAEAEKLLAEAYRYTSTLTEFYQAPELVEDAEAYAAIGKKERAAAMLAQAVRVIEATKYSTVKGPIFYEIAMGYLKIGDEDKALQTANQIRDDAVSGVGALLTIASKYSGAEQLAKEKERIIQDLMRP